MANQFGDQLRELKKIKNLKEQSVAATKFLNDLQEASVIAKGIRQNAVLKLLKVGATFGDIAKLLGVNRSRAYQIAQGVSSPPPSIEE
jgi:transcriptional regulator with XRE-family HTH domain